MYVLVLLVSFVLVQIVGDVGVEPRALALPSESVFLWLELCFVYLGLKRQTESMLQYTYLFVCCLIFAQTNRHGFLFLGGESCLVAE